MSTYARRGSNSREGQGESSKAQGLRTALFLTAFVTLMLELLLVRVFDAILVPDVGYAVIALAMFASGMAGVFAAIRTAPGPAETRRGAALLCLLFGASVLLLRPILNATPLLYEQLRPGLIKYGIGLASIYLILVVPFFTSGLIFARLFAAFPLQIRSLYGWDLTGAALGCVLFVPLVPDIGPGGLMVIGAGLMVIACAALLGTSVASTALVALSLPLMVVPFVADPGSFEFQLIRNKRGLRTDMENGRVQFTRWDPISRIDVVVPPADKSQSPIHVAYDGGSQSSHFFPFDGDLEGLREELLRRPRRFREHFWTSGVVASHYLRRDTDARVLIFGSAAGQETKAALAFGADSVLGVELVGTVVELGKNEYSDFIGGIFRDPRVDNRVGEGRSLLRSSSDRFDIIQIFSNHTSSTVAAGTRAMAAVYLQTVEAYREYFSHLADDGILHINHHFYPRMVTTAARAWKEENRADFRRHVVIYERPGGDTLPTMLIKMSPWTSSELAELDWLFASSEEGAQRVVSPDDPQGSALSAEFFSGDLREQFVQSLAFDITPSTDDWPFFNRITRTRNPVKVDPERFLDEAMVQAINGRLRLPLGEYSLLVGIGLCGVLFGVVLIVVPLVGSQAGRVNWQQRWPSLGYFACLGAGFIIVELTLIQMFMKLIGFPLYVFSTVLFTLLIGAGLGSRSAQVLRVSPNARWMLPFVGVLVLGPALWYVQPAVVDILLGASLPVRVGAAVALTFPLAFFLGMPFPLGVLSLADKPAGAVAWCWATNALMTVLGGTLAIVLSMILGFSVTLLTGLALYVLAFWLFVFVRRSAAPQAFA